MLFVNYYIFSGSAEALVRCGGNYSICWLLTFLVISVPNIMKIRQCFLELQLKCRGCFWDTGQQQRKLVSFRVKQATELWKNGRAYLECTKSLYLEMQIRNKILGREHSSSAAALELKCTVIKHFALSNVRCQLMSHLHLAVEYYTARLRQRPSVLLANVNSRSRSRSLCRRPSVCRLSVTFVHPTQAIEIFGNVLRHLVHWTSVDFEVKFYGDLPRGTPPAGG